MSASRRRLLAGGAAVLAASGQEARGSAPFRNEPSPAWHRFRIGGFEATIVSDGALSVGDPAGAFPNADRAEGERLLRDAFLAWGEVVLQQNALIVNTGRQLVLFDTGMGDSMGDAGRAFGPTTGRLLRNMRAAGIEPAQIDAVVLTHPHGDHCWALVDANGERSFPNAQVAIAEADLRFWTDEDRARGTPAMAPFIAGARRNLGPYRDRMIMVRDGAEVVPGVTAIAAPGHTVGHTIYRIGDGDSALVFTGDLAHHHVLLLRRPQWQFAYDTDPIAAAATRTRLLERFAADRTPTLFYHFPWPGLGHIGRAGDGFAWHPLPLNVTTLG